MAIINVFQDLVTTPGGLTFVAVATGIVIVGTFTIISLAKVEEAILKETKLKGIEITYEGNTYTRENGLKNYSTNWNKEVNGIRIKTDSGTKVIRRPANEFILVRNNDDIKK